METTLSSKGQIVIPLQIRNSHGWRPGIFEFRNQKSKKVESLGTDVIFISASVKEIIGIGRIAENMVLFREDKANGTAKPLNSFSQVHVYLSISQKLDMSESV